MPDPGTSAEVRGGHVRREQRRGVEMLASEFFTDDSCCSSSKKILSRKR